MHRVHVKRRVRRDKKLPAKRCGRRGRCGRCVIYYASRSRKAPRSPR